MYVSVRVREYVSEYVCVYLCEYVSVRVYVSVSVCMYSTSQKNVSHRSDTLDMYNARHVQCLATTLLRYGMLSQMSLR